MKLLKRTTAIVLCFLMVFSVTSIFPDEFFPQVFAASTDKAKSSANEEVYEQGDYTYTLIDEYTHVSIKSYKGSGTEIEIPDTIDGKEVTVIGDGVFRDNKNITSVTLGQNITKIGNTVFQSCSALEKVVFNKKLKSIGNYAFRYNAKLTEVTFPDSLETIGDESFYNDGALKKITFGNGIKKIGSWAFYYTGVEEVTLPSSIETINYGAFYDCKSLKTVTVAEGSSLAIGERAFAYCNAMESITLGEGVKSIGTSAFVDCDKVTELVIPDSVTTFGNNAFESMNSLKKVTIGKGLTAFPTYTLYNCASLEELTVSSENETFKSEDNVLFSKDGTKLLLYPNALSGDYKIPDSVTTICESAFRNASNITSVTFGDGVTSIAESAFRDCSSITGVTIGKNVKTIGTNAFTGCKALASVTLGENTETVGNSAFSNCAALEKVEFNKNLKTIGSYAFRYDGKLSAAAFHDSLETIGDEAFYNDTALKTITFGSGIKKINSWAFHNTGVEELTIPASIETIGYGAFYDCKSLKSVTVAKDSSLAIGERAFAYCNAMESITLGEGVKSIGVCAFIDNDKVTELSIPDSVTTVGNNAFESMNSLTKITIGKGVTAFPGYTLYNCAALEEIVVSSDNETFKSVDNVLLSKDGTDLIIFPNAFEGEYKIPDSVTTIAESAFRNSSKLTSVTFGDGITSIANSAFRDCNALTSVTIGKNVKTIGQNAFTGCKALASVTLGENTETIGNSAFSNCGALEKVDFNKNLKTIGSYAFRYDGKLSAAAFPDSLETIGDEAFYNDSAIKTITFGSGIKKINSWAFDNTGIEELTIPASMETIGYGAFYDCKKLKTLTVAEGANLAIGERAFAYCNAMESITLGEGVKSIGVCTFIDNDKVTELVIPDSVTSIGNNAFESMNSLESLTIGKSVKSFPVSAITSCEAIAKINVSDDNETYKSIDNVVLSKDGTSVYIFPKAYSGEYTIPDTVTSIANQSFVNCKNLTGIKIGKGVKKISDGAFTGCTALTTLDVGEGVTEIGTNAFNGCKALKSVNIGKNTQTVGNSAFKNCTAIETLIFGEQLKTIGSNAFYNNSKLTEIELPDTVETISEYAFGSNSLVKSVYLGTSLKTIGSYAFSYLPLLTSVSIPDTIKSINYGAFYACDRLETVYIYGEETAIDAGAFNYSEKLSTIYVPENTTTHTNVLKLNNIDKITVKFLALNFYVTKLKNTALSSQSAKISWSKPDGYDDIVKYIVYRNNAKVGETEKTSFSDEKLLEGKTYTYSVSAVNSEGVESEKKEIEVTPSAATIASVTTPYEDNVIGGVKPVKITASLDNSIFSENGTAEFSYSDDGKNFEAIPDATLMGDKKSYYTYWDLKSVKSGKYTLRFEFTDKDGAKSNKDIEVTVDRTAPAPINNFVVQGQEENIVMSWDLASEIDTEIYRIYRKTDEEADFHLITEIRKRDTLSYTDKNVEKGILYTYYIVGVDKFNQESIEYTSVPAGVIDDVVAPQVTKITPAINSTVYGTYRFSVTAKDNVGVTKIELYYSTDRENWILLDTASGASFAKDIDTTVMPEGMVYVKAIAYDVADNASNSTPVYAYKVDNTGPAKVTGVQCISSLSTIVTLSWDKIEDDALYYFQVERKNADGTFEEVAKEYSTLGTNIRNLAPDTEYTYRVVAYDRYRNRGTESDEITVKTASDTAAPSVTSISPGAGYFNKDIEVTITAQDDDKVESMEIQVSADGKTWKTVKNEKTESPSYIVKFNHTLKLSEYGEGTVYIRGLAADLMGNKMSPEDASYNQYIFDTTAPAAPQNVKAEAEDTSIHVIWDASESEDMYCYKLSRSETEDGDFEVIAGTLGTVDYYDQRVNQFTKYYYKVQTVDQAGNISDYSEVVAGSMKDDTTKPEIHVVSVDDNEVVGPDNAEIKVTASDNIKLASITVKYSRESAPDEFITFFEENDINLQGTTAGKALPVKDLKNGEKIKLQIKCKDTTGNESDTKEVTIVIKNELTGITNLTLSEKDGVFTGKWDGSEEAEGYYIYRKTNLDSDFVFINSFTAEQTSFDDGRYSTSATDVCYKVVVFDSVGNSAEAVTDSAKIPGDVPPVAVITGPAKVQVNTDYIYSAAGSSDDRGIASYSFTFSDGGSGTDSAVVHKFTSVGTFTVTLTVTDTDGNTNTATKTVVVSDKNSFGKIQVTVTDGNGKRMANTPVYLDLAESGEVKKNTDGNGVVEFEATLGSHTVASYKADYLPVKSDVVALNGTVTKETLVLVNQPIITGEFEIHRMNLYEIKAAGIDINAAENQNVVKINVRLNYSGKPQTSEFYWNGTSIVKGPSKIRVYDTAGRARVLIPHIFGRGGGIGGNDYSGTGEPKYQVAYLDVPVEMSVLKEFFDVKLHILNNASPEFSVSNNYVTLNVPEGLTIMNTSAENTESSSVAYIDKIVGQEQKTLRWILRGDKPGSYDISADYIGTLDEFNEPVKARFESDEKITVYGATSLDVNIETEKETEQTRVFYNIIVTNSGSVPYYNFQWKSGKQAFAKEFVSIKGERSEMLRDVDILLPQESIIYHYKSNLTITGTDTTIYDHYRFVDYVVKDSTKSGTSVSVTPQPTEHFTDFIKDYEPSNADGFSIQVVDKESKPISGASIKIDDKSYTTDSNGNAKIEVPRDASARLTISKDGYHTYQKYYYNKYCFASQDTLILIPANEKCYVSQAIVNESDVLKEEKPIDIRNEFDYTFNIDVLGEGIKSVGLAFNKNGKVIKAKEETSFEETHVLTYSPSDFIVGRKLYVIVTFEDGEKAEPVELKTRIVDSDRFPKFEDFEANFLEDLTVTIPSSVPVVGGKEVSIDFSGNSIINPEDPNSENNPLQLGHHPCVKVVDGELFVGYGISLDTNDDAAKKVARNFMAMVQKRTHQRISKPVKNAVGTIFGGINGSVGLAGYLRFGINEFGDFKMTGAAVYLQVQLEGEWEHTVTTPIAIPITVMVEVSGGAEAGVTLSVDLDALEFALESVALTFTAEVGLRAGVGVKGAHAGVYGALNLETTFDNEDNYDFGLSKLTLGGEAGVYLKALEHDFKIKLSEGEWDLYNRAQSDLNHKIDNLPSAASIYQYLSSAEEFTYAPLDTTFAYQPWNGANASKSDDLKLYNKVNGDAAPQIITSGDTSVMIFKGVDKDAKLVSNSSALYYSVYDKSTKTWSDPVKLDKNHQSDYFYEVKEVNGEIYLAYSQSNKEYETNPESILDAAKDCDVYVSKYNKLTGKFMTPVCVSDEDNFDQIGAITEIDGTPAVVWVNNAGNNPFLLGTDNTIKYRRFDGENWLDASVAESKVANILAIDAGMISADSNIAYVSAPDGKLDDVNSRTVNVVNISKENKKTTLAKDVYSGNVQFAKFNGNDVMLWSENDKLNMTSESTLKADTLIDGITSDAGLSFDLVTSENGDAAIVFEDINAENGSSIYAYYLDSTTGEFGSPVELAASSNYAEQADAAFVDNQLNVIYVDAKVDLNDDVTKTSSLNLKKVDASTSMVVEKVIINNDHIIAGDNVSATVQVKNISDTQQKNFKFEVIDSTGKTIGEAVFEDTLKSGESKQFDITFKAPYVVYGSEITVKVTDSEYNEAEKSFEMTDCDLTATVSHKKFTGSDYAEVTITNYDSFASAGELQILNDKGEAVFVKKFMPVGYGEYVTIKVDDVSQYANAEGKIRFFVEAYGDDTNPLNNSFNIFVDPNGDILYGDANLDGVVDITDATLIQKYTVKKAEIEENAKKTADFNHDGTINIKDVTAIQKFIAS